MTLIYATGDLILERPDATALLRAAAPVLAEGDVVVGHLEVPHTTASEVMTTDVPARPAPPSALDAVAAAGFDVLTLAGNHVFDLGPAGIADTRRHCAERGLLTTGAGPDLEAAWEPAVVEHGGRRVVVLSVNCVGPRETWATATKPGAAHVEVLTHYETLGANPGGPPRIHTVVEPGSLAELRRRIAGHAAADATIILALHKGLVHVPAELAAYEHEVARAAIDAGAAAVIGHHAHILKGVEVYRGRPILHGLGNFATVTGALSVTEAVPERAAWARRRAALFGFEPDPSMPEYPFHPESRNTAIAALEVGDDGAVAASLVPCRIDDDAAPVPLARDAGGGQVGEYIRRITRDAGLPNRFAWRGDRLTVETEH
ncbi:CapA family protein [Georgenia alba]|uniref:CapA family protein n=1 Tax=Georgenia alba TaxID=2233858 RepID=A0ABW2Q880_9MICO